MPKHEDKLCPRCARQFECKVGSILLCQCSTITLTETERDYIREQFNDCLCAKCMNELKSEHANTNLKNKIKKLLAFGGK